MTMPGLFERPCVVKRNPANPKQGNDNTIMLIGTPKPQQATANTADIIDVQTDAFENAVLKESMTRPVVVDFWAPWCGPCKQLMPALEAAVAATKGKVMLAKVNIDDNPELAQALRIQSVPAVFVFFQGQPVTAFTGVKASSELNMLMDQLCKMAAQAQPDAINIPESLSAAAQALTKGDIAGAQDLYLQVLAQEETNAPAYAGLVRCLIAAGELEQARGMLDSPPDDMAGHDALNAAAKALALAADRPDAGALESLAERSAAQPDDHQLRFDYACALFAAGQRLEAFDQLIEIMRRDKAAGADPWQEDKARLHLLSLFDALGPVDPDTVAGRRKLSTFLFS